MSRTPLPVRPRRLVLIATPLLLALACSVSAPPRAASSEDPSNPRAPTQPFEPPANTVAEDVVAKEDKPPPKDVEYACPMGHVVREAPGVCPVCGMTLEPRKKAK